MNRARRAFHLGVVNPANPVRVAAVNADVDRAGFGAFAVAAGVVFHGSIIGAAYYLRLTLHPVPVLLLGVQVWTLTKFVQ